jgi:predicted RNase H-like HicB family nuclease
MATKKDLDYYLNLNWTYTIEKETDKKQSYYIIRVNELPGACTDAPTIEEGMREIEDVIQAVIELYLKNGEKVPEPINKKKFKGNIAYRTTSERHYYLAKLAHQQHKSLSKTLDMIIDAGLQNFKSRSV